MAARPTMISLNHASKSDSNFSLSVTERQAGAPAEGELGPGVHHQRVLGDRRAGDGEGVAARERHAAPRRIEIEGVTPAQPARQAQPADLRRSARA